MKRVFSGARKEIEGCKAKRGNGTYVDIFHLDDNTLSLIFVLVELVLPVQLREDAKLHLPQRQSSETTVAS